MRLNITEVGLRDGLQILPITLSTQEKIEILNLVAESEIKNIELASFVSAKMVPQMSNAEEFSKKVLADKRYSDINFSALVPNLKGALSAADVGFKNLRFFLSISETHNLKNTGQTIKDSFFQLSQIRAELPQVKLSVILSTAFGCPYEGLLPASSVINVAYKALEIGADRVGLADTYGKATASVTNAVLTAYLTEFKEKPFLHMHDENGNAYENAIIAMEMGISDFDTAFSGLGGCPAIVDFHGNLSTEKFLHESCRLNHFADVDYETLKHKYNEIAAILNPYLIVNR